MGDKQQNFRDFNGTTESGRCKEAGGEPRDGEPEVRRHSIPSEMFSVEETGSKLQDEAVEIRHKSVSSEAPPEARRQPVSQAHNLVTKCSGEQEKCPNNLEDHLWSSSELPDNNICTKHLDSANDNESHQSGQTTSANVPPRGIGDTNVEPEVRNELPILLSWNSPSQSKPISDTEELETMIYKAKLSGDNSASRMIQETTQVLYRKPEVTVHSLHIDHYEEGIHCYGSVPVAPSITGLQPENIVEYLSTSQNLGNKYSDYSFEVEPIDSNRKEDCSIQPQESICEEIIIEVTNRSNATSLSRLGLSILSVANIFMSFFSVGSIFGLGVLFVAIVEDFQSTRAEAAPIMSVYIGIMYMGGGVVGPLMNKYNGGYICMVGGVVGCVGCIISSFAPSIPYIIVGTGVLAGSAVAIGYFLPFLVTRDIFDKHRTTMLTVMDITPGLGGVVFPYMTSKLQEEYGWRGAILIYGGIMFHCVPIGYLNAVVKRRYLTTLEIETSFKEMFNCSLLKSPTFLIVLFNMMMMFSLFPAVNIFFVDVARERGFDIETAATILSINGFCNVAARVVIIASTPFVTLSRLTQWTVYVPVLSTVAFSYMYATTYNQLLVLGIIYGAFWGLTNASYSSAVLEVSGLKNFLPALAYCSLIGGITCLFFSPAVGALRDLTGSYDSLYFLTSGLGFFSSFLLAIISIKSCLQRRRANKKDNSTFQDKYTPKPDIVVNTAFSPASTVTDIIKVKRIGDENNNIYRIGEVNSSFSGP